MAPSRKSRSVNKQSSYTNEAASNKCGENANKTGQKKRKLSDMLGPQWTKEELENFYEAYRKYGKDWKKVASVVRHRSVEMVETLYSMNKAYLSLPEGVASVVGLIAMMTDHYYILGGSDSEQENNEDAETFRKPQKHAGSKLRIVQMSNLIRSRKAVTTAQSSPLPAQQSAAIALAQMNHLPVGPAVSHAPASSASSVAQPVSARRRHRPPSTTDTTSTSSTGVSGSQLGSRSFLYMMEARRRGGSKFPEIDVFGDVYVQPGNELAKSLHTTMMEKSQLVLQESASQLPPDMPLEFVDPPQDARFQILTKTLDQTLGRQPGTYCRGMGNPRRREPRARSSSQSNSLVNALTARVTALTTQMAELETKMSQFLQSLVRSGIPIPHFGPSLTSEPLQPEHGHHTSALVKNVQTSELHL